MKLVRIGYSQLMNQLGNVREHIEERKAKGRDAEETAVSIGCCCITIVDLIPTPKGHRWTGCLGNLGGTWKKRIFERHNSRLASTKADLLDLLLLEYTSLVIPLPAAEVINTVGPGGSRRLAAPTAEDDLGLLR